MHIVSEHIPDLCAIDLSGNHLRDLDSFTPFADKFKNLRVLYLHDNKIIDLKSFVRLKGNVIVFEILIEKYYFMKYDILVQIFTSVHPILSGYIFTGSKAIFAKKKNPTFLAQKFYKFFFVKIRFRLFKTIKKKKKSGMDH